MVNHSAHGAATETQQLLDLIVAHDASNVWTAFARLADPALPVPDLRLVHLRATFTREQLITRRGPRRARESTVNGRNI